MRRFVRNSQSKKFSTKTNPEGNRTLRDESSQRLLCQTLDIFARVKKT